MGFDVQNFGIGLLAGWASAYGVYRARNRIRGWAQAASNQASSAQNYATLSMNVGGIRGCDTLDDAQCFLKRLRGV